MTDTLATNEVSVALPNPSVDTAAPGEGGGTVVVVDPMSPQTDATAGTTISTTTITTTTTTTSSSTSTVSVVTPVPSPIPIPKPDLQRKPTPIPQDLDAAANGPLMAVINKEVSSGAGHIEPRTWAMIERRSRQISKDKLTKEAFLGGIPEEAPNFEIETNVYDRPKRRPWLIRPYAHANEDMKTLTEGKEFGTGNQDHVESSSSSSHVPAFLKRLKAPPMPFLRKGKT